MFNDGKYLISLLSKIYLTLEKSFSGMDNKRGPTLAVEKAKEVLYRARSNCLAVENVKFHVK